LLWTLSPQAQKREQFGKVHQSLSLVPFGRGERFASILPIEQILEPLLNPFGQPQRRQIIGHL
jgi:hypothetical protein